MSEDKRVLRRYLWRYLNSRAALEGLKARLKALDEAPRPDVTGIAYQRSQCGQLIERQVQEVERMMLDIMRCLDLLEEGSQERLAMEAKYLDGLGVEEASRRMYISRATYYRLESRALDMLLSYGYVRERVQEYKRAEAPPKNRVPGG